MPTVLVTGAGRGFGRGIATAFTATGADIIGVARTAAKLDALRAELGDSFVPERADVTDPDVARDLIGKYRPDVLVLNAGATPPMGPIHEHTWETFSRNWEVDTRHVFEWTREALRLPLAPGSVVVAVSSGAAVGGSPLSGGYAGAKSAIRFISSYAADESGRGALGIRFVALLPQLTPATDLGSVGVAAYAERQGVDAAAFARRLEPVLTPQGVGDAVVELAGSGRDGLEYLLTGAGLKLLGDR
jgi:NAD(P)-dependent dehydrogenase (short-subunit alcohol dehydrogenase family)